MRSRCAAVVARSESARTSEAARLGRRIRPSPRARQQALVSHRKACEPSVTAVKRSLVGNYVTSLDMAGCSITVSLLDDNLTSLWDAPVHTAGLRWGV